MGNRFFYMTILILNLFNSKVYSCDLTLMTKPDIPYSIYGIDMLEDGLTGWAVCDSGVILHTKNGWQNWVECQNASYKSFILLDVDFVDSLHGWVVGGTHYDNASIILHTVDGCKSWRREGKGLAKKQIHTISAVDINHAWCAGNDGVILYTNDGEIWNKIELTNNNEIYGLHMYDAHHGVAVGENETIYFTKVLNGVKWQTALSVPDLKNMDLNAVYMMDSLNVWAVGDGISNIDLKSIFLKSEDGGCNWKRWEPPEDIKENMFAVKFTNDKKGVAVGAKGLVFITDNGETWQPLTRQFGNQIEDVAVVGEKIWAVGSVGSINYSEDFGKKWMLIPKIIGQNLFKITAVSNKHIIAVGYYSSMLETTDSGFSWRSRYILPDGEFCARLKGIDFASEDVGYVCGYGGFIAKTTDAGKNWFNLSHQHVTTKSLNDLYVIDEQNVWCCGNTGTIIKTTDGGISWIDKSDNRITINLNSISFLDNNHGIIVGDRGTILYSTDAGENWSFGNIDLTTKPNLMRSQILDATHAWTISRDGDVLFSSDFGANWTMTSRLESSHFNAICFYDTSLGWAINEYDINDQGYIYKTTDGGYNWKMINQSATKTSSFRSFALDPDGDLWIAGDFSTILLCRFPCDIISIYQNSPHYFKLSQNYPNPFNSSTQIKYEVGQQSHVFIGVYNLLGKEVKVLVNEMKNIGSYTLSLEANSWSSGIYFVKMVTDNFKEINKLTLIK